MTSLRELLEAKQRRRLAVPIQVSDPADDHETWMGYYVALQAAKNRDDDDSVALLEQQLHEANDQLRSHWVYVELEALSSSDWEQASRVWADNVDSADGIDWPRALAPLLAESCTDPELRSVEWWEAQLARPTWSEGDRDALKLALLRLNVSAIEPHIPKD